MADSVDEIEDDDNGKNAVSQQKKVLRAQIQQLKKSGASKGDKKAKKAVQEQVRQLEVQIEQLSLLVVSEHKPDRKLDEPEVADGAELTDSQYQPDDKKLSRQQQRKLKKQLEYERIRQEALDEPAVDLQALERQKLQTYLDRDMLKIHEIKADGDCMFSAVVHQHAIQQAQSKVLQASEMRQQCVNYMLANKDEYAPFVDTDDPFDVYCQNMLADGVWGGELELKALASLYKCVIRVYRADAEPYDLLPDADDSSTCTVRVSYHRHEYGLGAHYNSLIRKD